MDRTKKFKGSDYNLFLKDYDVFNLMSKQRVKLNKKLVSILKSKVLINDEVLCQEDIDFLLKSSIIKDRNFDEGSYNNFLYNATKYDKNAATFIISVTLACNFNCHYCLQKHTGCTITDDKIEHLEFFLKNYRFDTLRVRWTGGEPLIAFDKIVRLSEVLKKVSSSFKASLSTNGYLLTEEIVKKFKLCNIGELQVTLDGLPERHNKLRYTTTDDSTFDKVVEGIRISSNHCKVVIRTNFDNENVNEYEEFLKKLDRKGLKKQNIELSIRPLIGSCSDCYSSIIPQKSFSKLEKNIIKIVRQYGFKPPIYINSGSNIRCLYHQIMSFVIDPDLKLYKCPVYTGDTNFAVGYIDEKGNYQITDYPAILKGTMHSPFDISECKNCTVLPLCYGKCVILWNSNNSKDVGCIPDKYTLKDKLECQ